MKNARVVITGSIGLLAVMALSSCAPPVVHQESGIAKGVTGRIGLATALPETGADTPSGLAEDIATNADAWSTALGGQITVIAPQADGSVLVRLAEGSEMEQSFDVGGIRLVVDQDAGGGGALTLHRQTASASAEDLEEIALELSSGESKHLVWAGVTDVQGVIVDDDSGNMTLLSADPGDVGKFFAIGHQVVVTVEYGSVSLGPEQAADRR